jgi:hypothetical protein
MMVIQYALASFDTLTPLCFLVRLNLAPALTAGLRFRKRNDAAVVPGAPQSHFFV